MTTFTLTSMNNEHSGGNGTDIFEGPGGGNDVLRGNGGNDTFNIQYTQTGVINGGAGHDQIRMVGGSYIDLNFNLSIKGVEELTVDSGVVYAKASQLSGFETININNDLDYFSVHLWKSGGSLDFRESFTEPQTLNINAELATSAVQIVGSERANEIIGSDFGDKLAGAGGGDTLYGGFGNDIVGGGRGKDTLYGDDGRDAFVFNQKPGAAHLDHLGDFRPTDDVIQLENSVLKWAGQDTGPLAASAFKVIGNGQRIDANDHILYNESNGEILFDVDGRGGEAAVAFAVADNFSGDIPNITHQDFVIV